MNNCEISELSEIIRDLFELYNWWSGVTFSLQLLVFVAYLNSNYVPTSQNAIIYLMAIIGFLLLNAVVSAFEGVVIGAVIDFIKDISR